MQGTVIIQQDRQCTYNVTLKLMTIVVVEEQYVLHIQSVCL